MKNKTFPRVVIFSLVLLFVAAAGVVYTVTSKQNNPETYTDTVSARQIETAKNDIAELFADRAVEHCPHPDLPEFDENRHGYVINYRYLRINKQANRAIISSCDGFDTLLAKAATGEWVETTVNLTINNRVNPEWQKACMIEDITVADDTVRPENRSIDELNLKECKSLSGV